MSSDNRQICVNLPAEVVRALDERGRREERSRSRLVLRYVRSGLLADGAIDMEREPAACRGTANAIE